MDNLHYPVRATRRDRPAFPFWPMLFDNITIRLLGSDDFPITAKQQAAQDLTAAAAEGALSIAIGYARPLARTAEAPSRRRRRQPHPGTAGHSQLRQSSTSGRGHLPLLRRGQARLTRPDDRNYPSRLRHHGRHPQSVRLTHSRRPREAALRGRFASSRSGRTAAVSEHAFPEGDSTRFDISHCQHRPVPMPARSGHWSSVHTTVQAGLSAAAPSVSGSVDEFAVSCIPTYRRYIVTRPPSARST